MKTKIFKITFIITIIVAIGIGGIIVYAVSGDNVNQSIKTTEANSDFKDSQFTGTVHQLLGDFIFVVADEADDMRDISSYVYVSLAFCGNETDIVAGDNVIVYYDGDVMAFAGMAQINNVFDIVITGNSGKSEEELRLSPPVFEKPNFPINENGQTYGSASACNYEDLPDLIQAVGTNGKEGYVYRTDLECEQPNNPEEAVEYVKRWQKSRTIPLYENDGITIIGDFKFG